MEEYVMMRNVDTDLRMCPECGKEYDRKDMEFSRDCHGITYRLLCFDCLERIYEEKGFDGEYYTEADECLDYDY